MNEQAFIDLGAYSEPNDPGLIFQQNLDDDYLDKFDDNKLEIDADENACYVTP